ncbi:uncharacterized protein LOC110706472 [Chenopodium quinoa]|uniref:Cytochrome c oxidase assembly factor 6 n=1 Tax=Chenopodium quinoa TaxID=63459 RepID=A0A803NB42_CHEQI|nr:uncharacterized protein LOC110706472 [Chenopodium quinoa]
MSAEKSDKVHSDVLASARQACYKARDEFYACLERESGKVASECASVGLLYPAECKKFRANFENSCRLAWVKHFDRLHCGKKRTQRLLDDNELRRGPLTLPQQPFTYKPPAN